YVEAFRNPAFVDSLTAESCCTCVPTRIRALTKIREWTGIAPSEIVAAAAQDTFERLYAAVAAGFKEPKRALVGEDRALVWYAGGDSCNGASGANLATIPESWLANHRAIATLYGNEHNCWFAREKLAGPAREPAEPPSGPEGTPF
ncbi:MAG TPA: hypothetical protein VJB16_02110, partial [archaeon]|nr:hypothetical protein [archaeon]